MIVDHNKLFREKSDLKKIREEREKQLSKDRLKKAAQTKIKTTMIGALESIEKHFGFLIADNKELKETYDLMRSEILDKGNNQIRNLGVEFESYTVMWHKNSIVLPVINKDKE